jgi:hypothetical protein
MFVSAAVKLTPEVYARLKPFLDDLGLTPEHTQVVQEMLALRHLPNGPSISEIAQNGDLSAQTVGRLDKAAYPAAQRAAYMSAFISYGGPDEPFARMLYAALLAKGVHAYYFPESSVPGRRLHRTMSDAVYEYDVVISVCSESAVTRPGWLNELEQTLTREAREGGTELLIPVLLDDFVLLKWAPERKDLARQVQSRVAADFRGHTDEAVFSRQVDRLLAALAAEH